MTITRAFGFTLDTQTGAIERWAAGDPASVAENLDAARERMQAASVPTLAQILNPPPLTGMPPAMTHSEAVATLPGWRSPMDMPAVGEMVEVAMFAGRVGNHHHPGYPGGPWIERTTLLCVMRNGRGIFGSEVAQTGNVIAWRPIKPCRCGPDGCSVGDCKGRSHGDT